MKLIPSNFINFFRTTDFVFHVGKQTNSFFKWFLFVQQAVKKFFFTACQTNFNQNYGPTKWKGKTSFFLSIFFLKKKSKNNNKKKQNELRNTL